MQNQGEGKNTLSTFVPPEVAVVKGRELQNRFTSHTLVSKRVEEQPKFEKKKYHVVTGIPKRLD